VILIKFPEDLNYAFFFGFFLVVRPTLFCISGGNEQFHQFENISVFLGGILEAGQIDDEEEVVVYLF
jgi:hypothetical protein